MLRENKLTEDFYNAVIEVIEARETIGNFASDYIGEDLYDLDFQIVYDTLNYLKKKDII